MLPGQKPSETFLILNQPLLCFWYRVVVIVSACADRLRNYLKTRLPQRLPLSQKGDFASA
jgi:hypothetical protein